MNDNEFDALDTMNEEYDKIVNAITTSVMGLGYRAEVAVSPLFYITTTICIALGIPKEEFLIAAETIFDRCVDERASLLKEVEALKDAPEQAV